LLHAISMHNHQRRILVIDDQASVREMVADLIREFELADKLELAQSIQQAQQALNDSDWDVIVTDMSLSDGNILDLIESMQQGYRFPPIVLMSGYLFGAASERASALGIKHVLTKPFHPADLLDCIQNIFEGK